MVQATDRQRAVLILAAGAMTVMSGAAIAPALGEIHDALATGGGEGVDRFVLILPAVVVLIFGPAIGRYSGRFPPRSVLVSGLILLAAAGALGGFAGSYAWLFATRSLLGLATAIVLCAATAAIVRFFEGSARSRMMSAQTACNTLSGVVFIACGGLLAALSWRLSFSIYLLALPVAILAWRLDWGSGGAVSARRSRAGLRADLPALGMICLAMGCFYLLPTQVPFLQDRISGPLQAALVIAGGTLASAPFAMLSPTVSRKLGRPGALIFGTGLLALGNVAMVLSGSAFLATIAALLVGSGFGLILPLAILILMDRAEPADREAKSGWVASAIYSGQVVAVVFTTAAAPSGAAVPFALAAGALVFGLLAALVPGLRRWRGFRATFRTG